MGPTEKGGATKNSKYIDNIHYTAKRPAFDVRFPKLSLKIFKA